MMPKGCEVRALVIGLFIGMLASIGGAIAQNTRALGEAINAAGAADWARVTELRGQLDNQVSRDVVDWMRLRGRQGSFAECRQFLARNANYPGLPLLRQRCEYNIARSANAADVLDFFQGQLPRTGVGSLRFAAAHIQTGRSDEGAKELRRAWLTFNMNQDEHDAFVARNGATIAGLHEERMDMLLWRGNDTAAQRMMGLVSGDWQKLAKARIGLRARVENVNGLIDQVPKALKGDPGLAFERFLWRARKGLDDRAIELLLERSTSAEALGNPQEWANRRRSLARQYMRDRKPKTAYRIASTHFLESGSDYADLEWLSGFIALRKLNDPETALRHFTRFKAAVATPISLGRAGYWIGRAYEAAGNDAQAKAAYGEGAKFQSSFYGQLAAERGGFATDPAMAGSESFGDWREGSFVESPVFAAAILLQAAGQRSFAERFLVHLAESQSRDGVGKLANFALDLREPHIALMLSKQGARMGFELYRTYFPLGFPSDVKTSVPDAFALSIARRESEFDPVVISPAGARGLMQLMPGTAKDMSRKRGEEFSLSGLLSNPSYNARLGTAYLEGLSDRYRSNPVLMSIAYNAGPGRADDWRSRYGDPRAANIDVVDWIESLPFRETRNYVMRVTESFAPYRARISGKTVSINLSEELKQ
ncbi:MAG: lytic transglycosylase domain-containing protein [Litoreibacter sp.]